MRVMCDKCKASEKIFALSLDKNRTSRILPVRYQGVYRNEFMTKLMHFGRSSNNGDAALSLFAGKKGLVLALTEVKSFNLF